MANKSGTEKRQRTQVLSSLRVTPEERAAIVENAHACALSIPAFMRAVAMGKRPKSKLDQEAILSLIKVSADLGRLGGVLKQHLSEVRQGKDNVDVTPLLAEVLETQTLLREKIIALGGVR